MPGQWTYLDHAATTPVDPRVLEAMLPYFCTEYGNPSSIHRWGQRSEAAVEEARRTVADILGASPDEVIFTACGTESDNLAVRGVAFAERARRGANHILTTPVEHHAVLRTVRQLGELHGFEVDFLPVDDSGRVSAEELARYIRTDTALVTAIYANNEIGTINPIREMGDICREHSVPLHTDAVQAPGQLPIHVGALKVDLMSLGAHKFYGPKGVGVLFKRRGLDVIPGLTGGSQEFGLRPGTHNVPLIVGFARALSLAIEEMARHAANFRKLRDRLLAQVTQSVPDSRISGNARHRLPNHASFVFRGLDGNALLAALDLAGFACSSGSACKTGSPEPSEVLTAIGLSREWALGSLRVTVGRSTTLDEIDAFLTALPPVVARLRRGMERAG